MGQQGTRVKQADLDELSQKTHFTQDEIVRLFEHFKQISGSINADNLIDKSEFLQALGFQETIVADRLFRVFDRNGDGSINFKEFVAGLSIFSSRGTMEEKLALSFRIYDVDGSGHIDKAELLEMLKACLVDSFMDIPEEHLVSLVDSTFEETDINKDGLISFEEYREMAMRHPHIIHNITIKNSVLAAAAGDKPA